MAMDKTYAPGGIESKWYEHWENSGAFECGKRQGAEPYAIVMPPPNVTGSLHMGHALDNTLQDVLIRFERLRGKDVLWQPGTDHAGIATQMVVERQLDAQGLHRRDMGREAFLERVWQWKEESGGTITGQLRRLGASCDWSKERFTMDEGFNAAVMKKFVTLHKDGLLYKAKRLVNWDPKLKTAISDLEVEQREVESSFWHFRYPIDGQEGAFIEIATTRPETMLGDTAIAVHPDDERYKHLVGKMVKLPLVGRLIPIVADEYADPEQGSGAVKITPAHDFNDFEVGKRHNLDVINVLDQHACINENSPDKYRGMDRFEARKAIVADLDTQGFLVKVEPHKHMVPYGDRGGVVIEPMLMDQWYVDVEEMAKKSIEAVESGQTNFIPKNWEKTFFEWMRNIQPWCVSRQIWWGHQIPAWYTEDGEHCFVEETEQEAKTAAFAELGKHVTLNRDEDVLDTWFSSAMWPFATQGWPEKTDDLAKYYPNATLVTGFDIIFFWVARMMMDGLYFMGEVPFKNVYIHALVRDEHGAKMSKSKGNVIDPLEYIDRFGADALRFTLTSMEAQGRDIKLAESRVEGYRNFGTKLWNASRFCEMNGIGGSNSIAAPEAKLAVNKWIIGEVAKAAEGVTNALDAFRFNEASDTIYHFIWGTFCDWYVELIKPVFFGEDEVAIAETREVAGWALDQILVLLHPFMPFITEELWHGLKDHRSGDLIAASWPTVNSSDVDEVAVDDVNWLIATITDVRSARSEANVPAGAKMQLKVVKSGDQKALADRFEAFEAVFGRMTRVETVEFADSADIATASIRLVSSAQEYALPLEGVIDIDAEKARLEKTLDKLSKEAGGLKGRLGNENFLARAPEVEVAKQQAQLDELEETIVKTEAALQRLG